MVAVQQRHQQQQLASSLAQGTNEADPAHPRLYYEISHDSDGPSLESQALICSAQDDKVVNNFKM